MSGFRDSSLDSNEHYYGRSQRFTASTPQRSQAPLEAAVQTSATDILNELSLKELYRPQPQEQPAKSEFLHPFAQAKAEAEAPPANTSEVTFFSARL